MAVYLTSTDNKYSAVQFDLALPEGVSIAKDGSGKFAASLTAARISDHTLNVKEVSTRTYRFLVFSLTNAEISQGGEPLLRVTLSSSASMSGGTVSATLSAALLSDKNGKTYRLSNATSNITVKKEEVLVKDGFYYQIANGTATVIASPDGYKGAVTINAEIGHDGQTYRVTKIAERAFRGCSDLYSLTIPASVQEIGTLAFSDCPRLNDVTCLGTSVPTTARAAFDGTPTEVSTLHVPASAVDAYSNSWPWSDFKWKLPIGKEVYTITYMLDNEVYKTYQLVEGMDISAELMPTKEGYTFSGWSSIPETMPAENVTVTGSFTVNQYTLTYVLDGEEYKTYEVDYGTAITAETAPVKEGYTFSGWNALPKTMPASDVTVTGTFNINTYKLTYMVDGDVYKTYNVQYNSAVTPEAEPVREDYTFSGWDEVPETMPAGDVTVRGTFVYTPYDVEVEGIYYKLDAKAMTAGVSRRDANNNSYAGSVEIPQTIEVDGETYQVTSIRYSAFEGCSELTSVSVPEGVTSIGDKAFYQCTGITSLDIPSTVESIGHLAFGECTGLTKFTSYMVTLPKADGSIFEGASLEILYLPRELINLINLNYKSPWYPFVSKAKSLPVVVYWVDMEPWKYVTVRVGEPIVPIEEPTREGYTFSGWIGLPAVMPNEDVTVMGTFTATGIWGTTIDGEDAKVYDLNGNRIQKPKRGVNIIRENSGEIKKLWVK